MLNPCQNNGLCVNFGSLGYVCQCVSGCTGYNCSTCNLVNKNIIQSGLIKIWSKQVPQMSLLPVQQQQQLFLQVVIAQLQLLVLTTLRSQLLLNLPARNQLPIQIQLVLISTVHALSIQAIAIVRLQSIWSISMLFVHIVARLALQVWHRALCA